MGQVAVSAVSKTYGEPGAIGSVVALDNVSFEIPDNRFCAILGHSGCGKTTLLNIAAGFEQATKGVVTVDGTPIREPGWQHTMIFQDYALFPWMSVAQNIAFGLEMKNVPRPEREQVTRYTSSSSGCRDSSTSCRIISPVACASASLSRGRWRFARAFS